MTKRPQGVIVMLLCLSFALSGYNYLYGMSATRFEALEETLNAASAIPNLESQQQQLWSDDVMDF